MSIFSMTTFFTKLFAWKCIQSAGNQIIQMFHETFLSWSNLYAPFNIWTSTDANVELIMEHE